METLGIIIPVRSGSKRVIDKNTKPFAGNNGGLLEWKLKQLNELKALVREQHRWHVLTEMIVSTDDCKCMDIATKLGFKVHERDHKLCLDTTTAAQMIEHAPKILSTDHIMWVHVTSPLCTAKLYADMITHYSVNKHKMSKYDGLLSVLPFRNFMMNSEGKVINTTGIDPWPRTQDLEVWYEVTHSVFLTSRFNHFSGSRFGFNPYLYNMPKSACIDVDYPEDFELAEVFVNHLAGVKGL